jgi:hypothetical protein
MPKNTANLGGAREAKFDEFYTQYHDIEIEVNAYLDFNPDVFRDKTILLPCDDPEWSNFTKYFAQNFVRLGLKKLISTSYAIDAKPAWLDLQLTLFETQNPKFDKAKARANGKIYSLTRDMTGDKKIDVEDLEWEYLAGDGDFRSAEVTALRDEADIVITNPPFSLFREFLEWLEGASKKMLILGNMNAVTYKEVFPLVKGDKIWLGATRNGVGSMWFMITNTAPEKSGQKVENGQRMQTVGSSAWFTNLDHGRRHQPLTLMTVAENIKFSRHKEVKGIGYQKYDNYDAIEVPFTDAIPSDYNGVMGVPISFLSKYNPDQFEIVGITKTWDDESGFKLKVYPEQTQIDSNGKTSKVRKLNDGAAVVVEEAPASTYYTVGSIKLVQLYARILIRQRKISNR